MFVLHVGVLHFFMVQDVLANISPCFLSDWGPWSACSVTCGIGVRYRTTECDSSNPLPGEKQTKVEESCTVKPSCPQGTTSGSLLLSGYFNAAIQGHMIKSAVVYSIAECGLMCLQDSNCKSFNTCSRKSELLCELNNATYDEYGEDILSKFNCSYHSALK